MKRSTIVEKLSNSGCSIVVQNNPTSTDATIMIGYKIPYGLEHKFNGVAHLVEHLLFGDIIEGYDSTDIITLAKRNGCSVSASTSMTTIMFMVTIKSLAVPTSIISNNAYSRFDSSEEGVAFAIEFIKGVMKEHVITIDDLNKEKPIVVSEYERSKDNKSQRTYCAMTEILHDKTIIGSNEDVINSISIETVHEFIKSLPDPVLVVEYNDEIDVYDGIEEKINDVCNIIPTDNKPFNIVSYTSPSLLNEGNTIYNWYKNSKAGKIGELNTLGILVPFSTSYEVQDIESNLLQIMSLTMFLSVLNKGTFGNYLREELGAIYSMDFYGSINSNGCGGELMFNGCSLNSQAYNLNSYKERSEFIKIVEKFLTTIETPSIEDYIGTLTSKANSYKDVLYEGYGVQSIMSNMLKGGNTIYLDRAADFESAFDYNDFKLVFENMIASLSFIIL